MILGRGAVIYLQREERSLKFKSFILYPKIFTVALEWIELKLYVSSLCFYVQRHVRFSPIRDRIHVSCISRQILYCWVTREDPSREMLLFRCPVVSNSSQPQGGSQASLSLTVSWSLPKFMFIASVMPSSHLILWHPLLLLPSILPSIRDFPDELAVRIMWSKYWSSVSVLPMSIQGWCPLGLTGLISLLSRGLSGVFSSTTIQKHQPYLWSNSHICIWLLEKS